MNSSSNITQWVSQYKDGTYVGYEYQGIKRIIKRQICCTSQNLGIKIKSMSLYNLFDILHQIYTVSLAMKENMLPQHNKILEIINKETDIHDKIFDIVLFGKEGNVDPISKKELIEIIWESLNSLHRIFQK